MTMAAPRVKDLPQRLYRVFTEPKPLPRPTSAIDILQTQKKPIKNKIGFPDMARSGGFEPPTAWFVARYSIQLSYERIMSTRANHT